MTIFLADEAATIALAESTFRQLAENAADWTILLDGELGAGKSTFARAFIRAAGHKGPVPSPTYTLIEPYNLPEITIYHVDLYRVVDESELQYLGFYELQDGYRLIEWPERAPGLEAQADLKISIEYDGDGRTASVTAMSERAAGLIKGIK